MGDALLGIGFIFRQEIKELRQGADGFFLEEEAAGLEEDDEIAVFFVEIAEGANLGGAGCLTGGGSRLGNTVITEGAFIDRHFGVVDKTGIVGTGLKTALAEDALFRVHLDDAAGGVVAGLGRADADAGRLDAVVALRRIDIGEGLAEDGAFDHAHPDALFVRPQLHAVFFFAGDFTGLAVDTVLIIKRHGIIHNHTFFTVTRVSCMIALPNTGSIIPSIISLSLAPFLWAKVNPSEVEPKPWM